jgi:hypothetical protein
VSGWRASGPMRTRSNRRATARRRLATGKSKYFRSWCDILSCTTLP